MASIVCALKSDRLALPSNYLDNSLSFPALSVPNSELGTMMMMIIIIIIIK